MVNEVTLQPGHARESDGKIGNKLFPSSRHVYNSSIDMFDVNKAYKAPFLLWKQWLLDSSIDIFYVNKAYKAPFLLWKQWLLDSKTVVPGRTFADVVKQNAYSSNTSGKKSVPLEAIQMYKLKGMPPESVKEENVPCTSSPQV